MSVRRTSTNVDTPATLNRRLLRHYRRERRWTQGDLATAIGAGQPYISDLECGRRPSVKAETLAALAAALGVPMERLVQEGRRGRGQS